MTENELSRALKKDRNEPEPPGNELFGVEFCTTKILIVSNHSIAKTDHHRSRPTIF